MRKAAPSGTAAPDLAPVNAAHLAMFAVRLAERPAHTRAAYLRDAQVLATLAGPTDLAGLSARELRRFLATLHGRGLSGRSLARMLSSWRGFFRQLQDRDAAMKENPCAGLKAP